MGRVLLSSLAGVSLLALAVLPARADIVYLGPTNLGGQGFGNTTTILTLQAQGNNTTETASIVPTTGGFSTSGDLSGTGTETSKYGTPTLGSLGWTTGSQVDLLFNANEPNSNSVTIPAGSLQLSFFDANNTAITLENGLTYLTNSTAVTIPNTAPGQGNSGFLFGLDAGEQALLNSLVFSLPGFENFRIGLAATVNDVAGGPESFAALSAVPLPPSALLLASGLIGLGLLGRRKKRARAI